MKGEGVFYPDPHLLRIYFGIWISSNSLLQPYAIYAVPKFPTLHFGDASFWWRYILTLVPQPHITSTPQCELLMKHWDTRPISSFQITRPLH